MTCTQLPKRVDGDCVFCYFFLQPCCVTFGFRWFRCVICIFKFSHNLTNRTEVADCCMWCDRVKGFKSCDNFCLFQSFQDELCYVMLKMLERQLCIFMAKSQADPWRNEFFIVIRCKLWSSVWSFWIANGYQTGWWFGCHFFIFPYIGFLIIPIDELHHFSEGWPNHQPDIKRFRHCCWIRHVGWLGCGEPFQPWLRRLWTADRLHSHVAAGNDGNDGNEHQRAVEIV